MIKNKSLNKSCKIDWVAHYNKNVTKQANNIINILNKCLRCGRNFKTFILDIKNLHTRLDIKIWSFLK